MAKKIASNISIAHELAEKAVVWAKMIVNHNEVNNKDFTYVQQYRIFLS
jgi:hypothetical protein